MGYLTIFFALLVFIMCWRATRNLGISTYSFQQISITFELVIYTLNIINALNWCALMLICSALIGITDGLNISKSIWYLLGSSGIIYILSMLMHKIAYDYQSMDRSCYLLGNSHIVASTYNLWLSAKGRGEDFLYSYEYKFVTFLLLTIVYLQLRPEIKHFFSRFSVTFPSTPEMPLIYLQWQIAIPCLILGLVFMSIIFFRFHGLVWPRSRGPICCRDRIPDW